MRVEYICETCGKKFQYKADAENCEKSHEALKKRDLLKKRSTEAISKLINQHVVEFEEFPGFVLSDEATKIIGKTTRYDLDDILKELFDAFYGDDDEEE